MIVAKLAARPQREWLCVYCQGRGPASSETEMRALTKAHLTTCRVRLLYDARIARAMAVLEGT